MEKPLRRTKYPTVDQERAIFDTDRHTQQASEAFILRLGRLLHQHGAPADRLESDLDSTARALGLEAQFLSTPTGLQLAFGGLDEQRVHLLRMELGDASLGKLCEVHEIARAVETGEVEPDAGLAALKSVEHRAPRFGRAQIVASFGIASAGAARLFGGGWTEIVASFALGIVIASLPRWIPSKRNPIGLFEPLAAFVVALLAAGLARITEVQSSIVTLASLIVLLPGLSMTLAFAELASKHLVSGTARLLGALTNFFGLTLGIALAHAFAQKLLPPALASDAGAGLPTWTVCAAIVLSPPAFGVLFQARVREFGWIAAASLSGLAGAWLGKIAVGATLAGFVGALALGLVAQAYARRTRGPTMVPVLPGLLMLVPGSVGLESLTLFLSEHPAEGLQAAFRTILSALALVGGVLVARALLPMHTHEAKAATTQKRDAELCT